MFIGWSQINNKKKVRLSESILYLEVIRVYLSNLRYINQWPLSSTQWLAVSEPTKELNLCLVLSALVNT